MKQNAQEDKEVEIVSDTLGHTPEPLQSHTFCLKNNAAGLSSEEQEKPLNGTQPNPFVYSSVPAVPHAGNSLPSGALVNGPGSHPTSEVHCVLNKGTVLSNNVLDAVWQAEKDGSPEVLPPPSELQSDAWKNTAGPAVKTLATQPGVNTPLSHLEVNESKLASSTLSGDSAEQMPISKPRIKQTIEAGSPHSAECFPDDGGDFQVIRWDSTRECFLHSGRRLETRGKHQREKQRNTHVKTMAGSPKVNNSLNHSYRFPHPGNDAGFVDFANKGDSLGTQSGIKYSVTAFRDLSGSNRVLEFEQRLSGVAQEGSNEENDPEDEDAFHQKVEQLKAEQLEQDPFFFSCTICNVNFTEKRHFHRHMMYHLGKHNQVKSESVSQAFICRECGRLFCDSNSLMKHIIIHQDRLEKLREGIKGLENPEFEDGGTTVQCSHCVFGCDSQELFAQHGQAGDNLKHYYFCEECNYITLTQQALELHVRVAHLDTRRPRCQKMSQANDAEEAVQFHCKMGFFTSRDQVDLERRWKTKSLRSRCKILDDESKTADCEANLLKTAFGETGHFAHCSRGGGDICMRESTDIAPPQFKWHDYGTENTPSPSVWRISKHGKLILQPAGESDVATGLTCVEDDAEQSGCRAFGSSKQANCPATADFLLSARSLKLDQIFFEGSKSDPESRSLPSKRAHRNSPSMGRMSTPKHNSIDKMNGSILPRLSQRRKKHSAVRELEKGCEGGHSFCDDTSKATGSFLESTDNERNPYARKYFKKRQRFSAKDKSPHIPKQESDGDEDCSDIEQLIIKEYIDMCEDSSGSPRTSKSDGFDGFPSQVVEPRPCPYCPAVFKSGVGLSNHVRGHLHRAGLSYNSRHMVSPEQVALRDHQPQTRRRIPTGVRKIRKAVKAEARGEHTCPLCWSGFDTKTGLSNHVRGHLKRIGRCVTSTSKSPLGILNDLLQDRKEHENILQALNKSQSHPGPSASPDFSSSNLVSMRAALPVKIKYERSSPHGTGGRFVSKQEAEAFPETKELQTERQRGIQPSSSTLVELLKMRRGRMEFAARNQEVCCMTKDYKEETSWTHGGCDSNTICSQCSSSLPAAVTLSGHLQALACRKRIAVFEEPGYGHKQKKPRPRPGLKKKILPCLDAQIYTLTCRFCDLIFQGPLSVQEDWIKHLQRHLLQNSVPSSGMAMVEVSGSGSQNTNQHVS